MNEFTFTENDLNLLAERGIVADEAARQLAQLRQGQAYLEIVRPCTINDGILRPAAAAIRELCRTFAQNRRRFTRFVPASGAASRMFQGLFPAELDPVKAQQLRQNLAQFPFYTELAERTDAKPETLDDEPLFRLLLEADGLGLASLPKGLLPLHRERNYQRTAFAEHLHESHRLGIKKFHFTVSPEHRELFEEELKRCQQELGGDFNVDFSIQSLQTDTIALDCSTDGPFRNGQGELVFRPAGHGALIQNLGDCNGDLVLIRNIDNVVPERLQEPYQFWTEILGGLLLQSQQKVFTWLEKLEQNPDSKNCSAAATFLADTFGHPVAGMTTVKELIKMLDRPLRVCGMVPVSGQPGGGPFWAKDGFGQISPQIVEGVQIDPDNRQQQEIIAASTHFNPVNIACSLRDHHDRPYPLNSFIDENTALVASKSHAGHSLLALERPGLWNGAMSGWNTLFIEMPAETFHPIKTIFDLLQPAHQPG